MQLDSDVYSDFEDAGLRPYPPTWFGGHDGGVIFGAAKGAHTLIPKQVLEALAVLDAAQVFIPPISSPNVMVEPLKVASNGQNLCMLCIKSMKTEDSRL